MTKKCKKCGAELPIPDMDCPNCGFDENYKTRREIIKEGYIDYHKSMGTPTMIFLWICLIFIIICGIFIASYTIHVPSNFGTGDTISNSPSTIGESITFHSFETEIGDYINNKYIDEDSNSRYAYRIFFNLDGVSKDLIGSEVVTYLYNGDELIQYERNGELINNETEIMIVDEGYRNGEYYSNSNYHGGVEMYSGYSTFWSRELLNVTHFKVVIIYDGKVIFEDKRPFNMSNIEIE